MCRGSARLGSSLFGSAIVLLLLEVVAGSARFGSATMLLAVAVPVEVVAAAEGPVTPLTWTREEERRRAAEPLVVEVGKGWGGRSSEGGVGNRGSPVGSDSSLFPRSVVFPIPECRGALARAKRQILTIEKRNQVPGN